MVTSIQISQIESAKPVMIQTDIAAAKGSRLAAGSLRVLIPVLVAPVRVPLRLRLSCRLSTLNNPLSALVHGKPTEDPRSALNGKWGSEVRGSWTAISKAPYLKAISLWPKGDAWNGGGLFTGENSYWLNGCYGEQLKRSDEVVEDLKYKPQGGVGAECRGVYFPRLLRDGWSIALKDERSSEWIFEKSISSVWALQKIAHATGNSPKGKRTYYDEYHLVNKQDDTWHDYSQWEWADLDGERIVWAEEGKLWTGELNENGLEKRVELYDFNDMEFERIQAPY